LAGIRSLLSFVLLLEVGCIDGASYQAGKDGAAEVPGGDVVAGGVRDAASADLPGVADTVRADAWDGAHAGPDTLSGDTPPASSDTPASDTPASDTPAVDAEAADAEAADVPAGDVPAGAPDSEQRDGTSPDASGPTPPTLRPAVFRGTVRGADLVLRPLGVGVLGRGESTGPGLRLRPLGGPR